ncbi:MAG: DUF4962 domain-containing protein [Bacteroidia bacterium]
MKYWIFLSCLSLLLSFSGFKPAGKQVAGKYNVLFIAIDDLNDWPGVAGGFPRAITPNLDRLAASGTYFSNAHCQAPICGPSRVSIMSGLLPTTTGVYGQIKDPDIRGAHPLLSRNLFLPEYLASLGYKTMGVGKLFHGHAPKGVFEESGGRVSGFGPYPKERFHWQNQGTNTDWGAFPEHDSLMPDYQSANWAIDRLHQQHDRPFFLGVGFLRPHVPWYVPQKWLDMYPIERIETPAYLPNDQDDLPEISRRIAQMPVMPTTEWAIENNQWKYMVQAYLASISFADHYVGEVLNALENSPYANNTVVVLWSDHGYHAGEKNRFAKHSLWERATHVPLIFAGPGIPPSQSSSQPVQLLDMYPTLLELLSLPPNPNNEGHSLVPLLKNPKAKWPFPAITAYGRNNLAIRDSRYRYIRFEDGSEELYDHHTDPNEWTNLAGDQSYHKLKAELQAFMPRENALWSRASFLDANNYFIQQQTRVIHPRFREWVDPQDGHIASVNPPVLLCPVPEKGRNLYAFRLSSDSNFPEKNTRTAIDLPFAIFNPHEKLATGKWFWQYRIGENEWSETQSFFITDDVLPFITPDPDALIADISPLHPRAFLYKDEIQGFRNRNRTSKDATIILEKAGSLLPKNPPGESEGIATVTSTDKTEQEKLEKDASKKLGSDARNGTEILCQAYLLTGEQKYADAAIRWAMEIAGWDASGVSAISDFGDSNCMLAMAWVFDVCYDQLTDAQKNLLKTSITTRGNRFYGKWISMLEGKVFSAHVWQHMLERLFKTALATVGEIPEAADWLTFIYEVWQARSPVLGPSDGGWWNGNHYMELNALSLLEIPAILQSLTGQDFLRSAFYQNNPDWLIYSFPPKSFSEGFGNGTERQFGQSMAMVGYADALGRITGNPRAGWYAQQHLAAMGRQIEEDDEFRWYRLRWKLPASMSNIPAPELPQAKVFPLTGTANIHTNLLDPSKDLMVSLRASPFGSTSHAHADQNSLNIQFGGQKLFWNSGHRPSMGVPHYEEWFKASIGHNTVLIDGKGQPTGSAESYGWIPRFVHGEQITYCLGDASRAYDNEKEIKQKAGLNRFRRHLVLLRPDIIVIYDELDADHAAAWTWLLHSPDEIEMDKEIQQLTCTTSTAHAQVNIFGSGPVSLELSTKFDPEPSNYRNITDEEGNIVDFKDQWHIYARPVEKVPATRYLTIFQVRATDDERAFFSPVKQGEGKWKIGEWSIEAEMDAGKMPSLECRKADETAVVSFGKKTILAGRKTITPQIPGSTVLYEIINGKMIVKEAVDEFPIN